MSNKRCHRGHSRDCNDWVGVRHAPAPLPPAAFFFFPTPPYTHSFSHTSSGAFVAEIVFNKHHDPRSAFSTCMISLFDTVVVIILTAAESTLRRTVSRPPKSSSSLCHENQTRRQSHSLPHPPMPLSPPLFPPPCPLSPSLTATFRSWQ